jgi:hypothetical protein
MAGSEDAADPIGDALAGALAGPASGGAPVAAAPDAIGELILASLTDAPVRRVP